MNGEFGKSIVLSNILNRKNTILTSLLIKQIIRILEKGISVREFCQEFNSSYVFHIPVLLESCEGDPTEIYLIPGSIRY